MRFNQCEMSLCEKRSCEMRFNPCEMHHGLNIFFDVQSDLTWVKSHIINNYLLHSAYPKIPKNIRQKLALDQ